MNNEYIINQLKKELEQTIEELEKSRQELEQTRQELVETKKHLKKYTSPLSSKIYYEKHKQDQIERVKKYKENTNYKPSPEKKKEYNKQAYLKRKEKQKELEKELIHE
jgi:hypothetical protein